MASHPLPRRPHPIASAFFDAHDDKLTTTANKSENEVTSNSSTTVTKIRNSLGWRTRYSSSSSYPISIVPVESRRRGLLEGEGESVSFHVSQVFPGRADIQQQPHDHGAGAGAVDNERLHASASVSEGDCELGTGATVWPGSIVLLKYLEKVAHDPQHENVLAGKTVADLGSGTAITSIAAALLGAKEVVCTDGCDPVVDLARRNIRDAICTLGSGEEEMSSPISVVGDAKLEQSNQLFNCRGCKMSARKYRWGEGMLPIGDDCRSTHNNEEEVQRINKHFDIILGADCIVPKLYPLQPLVDAIDELSGDETVTYLSYEQRHYPKYDPAEEFLRLAVLRNLNVEVVPDHELHPMYPANDIQIWKVRRSNDNNKLCTDIDRPKNEVTREMLCPRSDGRSNHKSLLVGNHS